MTHGTCTVNAAGQDRIIHKAGEAEASGPGPPSTTKICKVGLGPFWARNF